MDGILVYETLGLDSIHGIVRSDYASFEGRAIHGLASFVDLRRPCRGLLIYPGSVCGGLRSG